MKQTAKYAAVAATSFFAGLGVSAVYAVKTYHDLNRDIEKNRDRQYRRYSAPSTTQK